MIKHTVIPKGDYDRISDHVLADLIELPPRPPQWPMPCYWFRGGIIPIPTACRRFLNLVNRLTLQQYDDENK